MSKRVTVITSYSGDTYEKVETDRTTAYHRLQMRPGYVKQEPERFTCECGFSWVEGQSGRHDCTPLYRAKVSALTSELAAAKEEIKAKEQAFRLCFDHGGSPSPAPEYCPKCITSERKETERLRELLLDAFDPMQHVVACQKRLVEKCMCRECIKERSKAALQSRQGEE